MLNYLNLANRILRDGERRGDRTGTGTLSLFGPQLEFNLKDGFPVVTTKKLFFKSVVQELLWFLRGETNTGTLGNHIWDDWADENGDVGPVYGYQWRSWPMFGWCTDVESDAYQSFEALPPKDQIAELVTGLKNNPLSRRHVVSAWNVADLDEMGLPPCHMMFQCYVSGGMHLDLKMYQRSADYFLGVPFNIASYGLLLSMLAHVCGYKPRRLLLTFGDVHIYTNHVPQVREQLTRTPFQRPTLWLNPTCYTIDDFTVEDVSLTNYRHHPAIKGEISV